MTFSFFTVLLIVFSITHRLYFSTMSSPGAALSKSPDIPPSGEQNAWSFLLNNNLVSPSIVSFVQKTIAHTEVQLQQQWQKRFSDVYKYVHELASAGLFPLPCQHVYFHRENDLDVFVAGMRLLKIFLKGQRLSVQNVSPQLFSKPGDLLYFMNQLLNLSSAIQIAALKFAKIDV